MIYSYHREFDDDTILFVDASDSIRPNDCRDIQLPQVNGTKGLILVPGMIPGWVIDAVSDFYRNRTQWRGWYDASQKGAVVTFSLAPKVVKGDLFKIDLPCLWCFDEGNEIFLRAGAKYPACDKLHRNKIPSRWKKPKN